jgi:hypothetical protein
MKRMGLDIIIIRISFLKDSLAFQVDPQILLNSIEINVALDVIKDELVFSAEE